ncbi:WSCD family member AGAP003962 [Tribolium castaneum]|uniref:WSCD family member CG9164-like Protein n=1 Tax=Tribolium castaneum TaxID=7070 RepID=D2A4G1_TRICA|nr:PREDICTED: WSCD family member AGAP003962 [Tribolium castaneum]EFA05808.2 WSCD family member CG9164-like Protein [Tribolium castaneum]|eukprot:XP_015836232.1 PREDICTED: WSCD family member AGAP003962 [Tribolium castaneum]
MHVTRVRYWILAILLFLYIAGVLFLSAVTLHEPKNLTHGKQTDRNQPFSRLKNYEYGIPGLRPPLRGRSKIQWCSTELKYIHPAIPPVALVSFPGSGNTWLRYLLQQVSGFYTGSVYKDYGLLKNGFPAENIANGSVLVVKTHEWGYNARKIFSKAIILVRSPAAAIQAEFNRQSGGHIGFASPDRYKRTKGKYWQQFVNDKLEAWKQTNLDWLYNFTGPTHVIFYEQLVDNLEHTLKTIINFLDISTDENLFKCALERKEGIYRRKRRVLNFDPYTDEMKRKLDKIQKKVYEAIYNFATPS